jgi:FkbM family methyltransferase
MIQKLEFIVPSYYSHGDIARTDEGWSYSPSDTHFGVWIREAKTISHDHKFLDWCVSAKWANDTGIFVDIGANIGTHSCLYASYADVLMCAEPFPTSFECLRRNLLRKASQLGDRPHIIAYCGAIGWASDESYFIDAEGNHGASHIADEMAFSGIKVPMTTLDNFYWSSTVLTFPRKVEYPSASLIKIDAEGYEGNILESGERILNPELGKKRPALILEVNHNALARYGWSQDRLFDYLRTIGYSPLGRWPEKLIGLTYEQLKDEPQYDIHCAPA